MVGDTYEMDIMPAKAEGFKTVWFLLRPEREREVLIKILRGELSGPDVAVSDLRELVEIGVFEK
jgi:FMN phosphatase YigB (HAD superfamily)